MVAVTVAVLMGAAGLYRGDAAGTDASSFVPVVPCRLADTRSPGAVGPRTAPIAEGETVVFTVRGANGNCSIPGTATGLSANVTIVNGTTASYLSVWPSDAPRPTTSTHNWVAGQAPTPNKVDVKLSADGRVSAYNNSGTVDVIIDIVGYYVAAGSSSIELVSQSRTLAANSSDQGFAVRCPAGRMAISGSYSAGNPAVNLYQSYTASDSTGGYWFYRFSNPTPGAVPAELVVSCV